MIEMDIKRKTFEELLPFYVNGTLSFEDKQFMQDYLIKFPELQAEVKFTEALRSAVKDEATQQVSEIGWGKLLKKYQEFHKKPTLIEHLKNACVKWGLSPAFAVVLGLLIAQSAAMLQLGLLTTSSAYRGLSTQTEVAPHLKITINPKTDYSQLVELLRKNGCRVVAGPSETGELWIRLEEPEKLNIIKADLLNSGLIDEVLSTGADADK
jgi:hypothetical protein